MPLPPLDPIEHAQQLVDHAVRHACAVLTAARRDGLEMAADGRWDGLSPCGVRGEAVALRPTPHAPRGRGCGPSSRGA